MAYLSNDAKKLIKNISNSQVLANQPQQPEEQGSSPSIPPQGMGSSAPLNVSPSAPSSGSSKLPASGSFTNLQSYAEKNKPASEKLAGAVSQGIQTAADVAKRNVQQTSTQFGQELERGSLQNRQTAQEEIRSAGLTAAGGVQDPEAEKQRVAQAQADYAQQQQSILDKKAAIDANLKSLQSGQRAFQDYGQIKSKAQQIQNYLSDYNQAMQNINTNTGSYDARNNAIVKAQNLGADLSKSLGLHPNRISDLQSRISDPQKLVQQIMKETGFQGTSDEAVFSDALANNNSVQPFPKYFDRTAEIAQAQKESKRLGQEATTAEEMAKFVPKALNIPEILAKASTYTGDVSDDRVKQILNAAYQGPRALSEIKRYDETLGKVKEAERKLSKIGKQGVSGDLLQDLFAKQRDYSRGERSLDEAILGRSSGLKDIIQKKKDIGSVADVLTQAETGARGSAGERSSEIDAIREASRGTLQDIASSRGGQVDERLGNVIENWDKLPQHFRDAITKSMRDNQGKAILSDMESSILGVAGGEGLYNAIKDAGIENVIKSRQADKERLVSKSEQGQLARLESLARLSEDYATQGGKLNFLNKFTDAEKAGTQSAAEALDTEHLRNLISSKAKQFEKESNRNVTGTGVGHDRYKSGHKSRDVWERVNLNANLKDALTKSGFNFNALTDQNMANPEAIAALSKFIQGESAGGQQNTKFDISDPQSYLGAYAGAFTGDSLTGMPLGSTIGNLGTNLVNSVVNKIPGVGSLVGNVFGSGKGNAYNTAKTNATRAAKANLEANLQKTLTDLGFNNRFAIDSQNEAVAARKANLLKLLAGMDTTNTSDEPAPNIPEEISAVPESSNIRRVLGLLKK